MKINKQTSRRGFTLIELLVVIVIIAALAALTAPMVIRQRKKADQTEAVSNARQIGLALFEFETEYGTFPDSLTATAVATATGATGSIPVATSNDRFRQMVQSGIVGSESIFYSKTAYTVKKVDDIISPIARACGAGEVGFGMIVGANGVGLSAVGNPSRPIVATPFVAGFAGNAFDPDFYDGKAVVLKLDNSVASYNILIQGANKGQILIGGATPLATGDATVWGSGGVTPSWVNPVPKGTQ
jgi:prepilin-type N-terminal cleavage/methylation domain-containing protein